LAQAAAQKGLMMCGRFAQKESPKRLAEYFHASCDIDFTPHYNIAPSSRIVTVCADQSASRHLRWLRWGLIPGWAKDPGIGNKLANARGETVAEKPSFRSAFKYRRCLIPASGFYEWKVVGGIKQPFYISLKSGAPLAMAGLWETWHPEGAAPIETCCIITTEANALMKPIHERMPVLLDPEEWEEWLSSDARDVTSLVSMIRPHESEKMQAWPVTRELNKAGMRDDEGLLFRAE
jgi:putative SOS response-associated peptidase YedK